MAGFAWACKTLLCQMSRRLLNRCRTCAKTDVRENKVLIGIGAVCYKVKLRVDCFQRRDHRLEMIVPASISRFLILAFAFTLTGTMASASPIYYTMTATATGTLGTTAFTGAAITVTSVADTSGAFVASGTAPNLNWENIALSSTITIAGIGLETFTHQTFWVDPNDSGDIIFGDVDGSGFAGGILGFTQLFVGLETYNLQSTFGPLSSTFDFETGAFNAFRNIQTSGGLLSLVATNDTFTAVTTPEPASLMLEGLGLMGLLALRRARQPTN